MATNNKPGADAEWDEGDSSNQSAPRQAVNQTATSPASPAVPVKFTAAFPRNASRDDILRIKASAEAALVTQPDNKNAEAVIAEAKERLRFFTESGLPVPRPEVEKPKDAESSEPKDEFPDNAKEARELHSKMKRQQVKTIRQRDAKRQYLSRLGAHISKLESGLPTIQVTANDHAATYAQRDAGIKRAKLEMLARQIPEVKALISEHDALKKAYETIGAVNTEYSTRIDALSKENAELNELLKKA